MEINKEEVYHKSGIYRIKNEVNGKIYIGSSKNLIERSKTHVRCLNKNKHSNPHLQRAWDKYGKNSFKFEVLMYCSEDNLKFYEQKFLDSISFDSNYNIARDSSSPMRGRECPIETKEYFSKKYSGKGNPRFGVELDEETREKISESVSSYFDNNENPFKGKSHTEEAKRKMRGEREHIQGLDNPRSNLTKEDIREIKRLLRDSDMSHKEISKEFPVCSSTISNINIGKSYSNITLEEDNNA